MQCQDDQKADGPTGGSGAVRMKCVSRDRHWFWPASSPTSATLRYPAARSCSLARLSQLDPDLGNFADGLNGNWLIGLVRSRKNSGKAAAVPTK